MSGRVFMTIAAYAPILYALGDAVRRPQARFPMGRKPVWIVGLLVALLIPPVVLMIPFAYILVVRMRGGPPRPPAIDRAS